MPFSGGEIGPPRIDKRRAMGYNAVGTPCFGAAPSDEGLRKMPSETAPARRRARSLRGGKDRAVIGKKIVLFGWETDFSAREKRGTDGEKRYENV